MKAGTCLKWWILTFTSSLSSLIVVLPATDPDANTREAGLRLDVVAGATEYVLESGGYAIVPGNVHKSKLMQRITSVDSEERMPPLDSKLTLSEREIALLARWIEQGAAYKPHWAFLPVQDPILPVVEDERWVRNPIDRFVLSTLEEKGIHPEPEANKETLLRRVTLDLTGLPPTLEEIDAFLADDRPSAYREVVDRLLQSDAYAERMALEWMDVARYADSHGYSLDGYRYMWPWRDWVIDAFKQNMPYDEFITWQLAGDLLPGATQEQRLATAFLRNQRLNAEGGIVPEEYLVEYAVDRTVTASTAFMGLTVECARCHDHKYDPISQREFFELYAFFNNVNELGEIRGDGNDGPQVLIASDEVEVRLDELQREIQEAEEKMQERLREVLTGPTLPARVSLEDGLLSRLDFERVSPGRVRDRAEPRREFTQAGTIEFDEGITGKGMRFTPFDALQYPVEFAAFDREDPFSFSFWVRPKMSSGTMSLLMKIAGKNDSQRGYEIALKDHRLAVQLISSFPASRVEVRSSQALPDDTWTHVAVSYDGSGEADGVLIYLNGSQEKSRVVADRLDQSMVSLIKPRPLRIGWKWQYQQDVDEGHAVIDDVRVYDRTLTGLEVAMLHDGQEAAAYDKRLVASHGATRDAAYQRRQQAWRALMRKRNSIQDTLQGVMVMDHMTEPRPSFILDRGMYDAPTERVYPSAPKSVLPFDDELPRNRLGFARWLVDERHPLTARVAVNRYWQLFFGHGLVTTPEDFGSQGALPSHPALLDWLASAFIRSNWDVQALHRRIVLSATYRQRSTTSTDKRAADPDNVLLARGPRHRLPAEMLRDQALAASGLLVRTVGGPPVKPYQPPGLWAEKSEFTVLNEYVPDEGPGRYRRGMYTFWRRTSPPPAMILFDAPTRDNCIVRRQHTTTPFQALVLLNDPQFVEAAQALARRMLVAHPGDVRQQIVQGYRLLTGSRPDTDTLGKLVALFEDAYADFQQQPDAAATLLTSNGMASRDPASMDLATHAAMTVVCNTMMSLQQSVYKL